MGVLTPDARDAANSPHWLQHMREEGLVTSPRSKGRIQKGQQQIFTIMQFIKIVCVYRISSKFEQYIFNLKCHWGIFSKIAESYWNILISSDVNAEKVVIFYFYRQYKKSFRIYEFNFLQIIKFTILNIRSMV